MVGTEQKNYDWRNTAKNETYGAMIYFYVVKMSEVYCKGTVRGRKAALERHLIGW